MNKLGYFRILVERSDSELVPYHIIEMETFDTCTNLIDSINGKSGSGVVSEELGLFETEHIVAEADTESLEPGTIFELSGELWGHYYSYETDCGREYDADFEIREEKFRVATEEESKSILEMLDRVEQHLKDREI